MKPKLTAILLLLSGIFFGLASPVQLLVGLHLHPPSTYILGAPALESIIKDDPKLLQKLRDEEAMARNKIGTIRGAHLQACILLAVAGGWQIIAGFAILTYREQGSRPLP